MGDLSPLKSSQSYNFQVRSESITDKDKSSDESEQMRDPVDLEGVNILNGC